MIEMAVCSELYSRSGRAWDSLPVRGHLFA